MSDDNTALLFGPYGAPALRVGARASCLFRDKDVVVYGWSEARTPWPLCYGVGGRSGGKGLLVDEELGRAIRHESATAVSHWWGVCRKTVTTWRSALGVGRLDSEGSRRLIRRATDCGRKARLRRLRGAAQG